MCDSSKNICCETPMVVDAPKVIWKVNASISEEYFNKEVNRYILLNPTVRYNKKIIVVENKQIEFFVDSIYHVRDLLDESLFDEINITKINL